MEVTFEYDDVFVNLQTYLCSPLSDTYTLNEHIDSKWLLPNELFSVEWAPADLDIIRALSKK